MTVIQTGSCCEKINNQKLWFHGFRHVYWVKESQMFQTNVSMLVFPAKRSDYNDLYQLSSVADMYGLCIWMIRTIRVLITFYYS